jgi:hypothetical protein
MTMRIKYTYIVTFSSVGRAAVYWLEGPGIEFRWKREFSHTYSSALGPAQPPV